MVPLLMFIFHQFGAAFVSTGTGRPSTKPEATRHDTPHASLDSLDPVKVFEATATMVMVTISYSASNAAVEQAAMKREELDGAGNPAALKREELDIAANTFKLSLIESTLKDEDASEPAKKAAKQLRGQMLQKMANPQGSLATPSPGPAPSPQSPFIIGVSYAVSKYILDKCKEQLDKVASQGTTLGMSAKASGYRALNEFKTLIFESVYQALTGTQQVAIEKAAAIVAAAAKEKEMKAKFLEKEEAKAKFLEAASTIRCRRLALTPSPRKRSSRRGPPSTRWTNPP